MAMFESSITEPIKRNAIKMLCCSSKVFRAKCLKGQGNDKGNIVAERTVLAGKDKVTSTRLLLDQRGAAALEMTIVSGFMMLVLLVPLTDLAAAGFKYISAWQALRAFGQSIQYSPPPDVTNASTWKTSVLANADPNFPISNLQLICGDPTSGNPPPVCSASNTASPKYYSYTTTITLAPMLLRSLLCSSSCTLTLPYSERFQ
jgi:hypothetical protein